MRGSLRSYYQGDILSIGKVRVMYCQRCGAPMFDSDKFCRNCGAVVNKYNSNIPNPQPVQQPKKLKWYHWVLIVIGILIAFDYLYSIFNQGQQYIDRSYYSDRYEVDEMVWLKTPDSTVFSRIGYDDYNEILGVTFRKAGSTYYYQDFPSYLWEEFLDSDSLSDYYNDNIKGQYTSSKGDY